MRGLLDWQDRPDIRWRVLCVQSAIFHRWQGQPGGSECKFYNVRTGTRTHAREKPCPRCGGKVEPVHSIN